MLLSLRGWGVEEFRLADPAFIAAARFALVAERLEPMLTQATQVLGRPLPDDPSAKLALARAKSSAAELIPIMRAALHLEEDS